MGIQDLGAVGEFVSSMAIVITLIFLAMETRRSRAETQQSNRQARQRIRTDLSLAIAVNPQLSELMVRSSNELDSQGTIPDPSDFGLTPSEGLRMYNYTVAYIRYLEDQFFSDLPEEDRFSLESQMKVITGGSYMGRFWERSEGMFDPRFRDYVDNLNH
jgi:hypothetical protein